MTGAPEVINDPRAEERYQLVTITIAYDTSVGRPIYFQGGRYTPDAKGGGEPTKLRSQGRCFSSPEEAEPIAEVHSCRAKLRSNTVLDREGFEEWTSGASVQPSAEDDWLSVPVALTPIAQAIRQSHRIVDREAECDEEEVLSCCEETWRRAMKILISHAMTAWHDRRIVVKVPIISAGPDGSIDLYWRAKPYGLLLNVPARADDCPSYYGDDRDSPDTNKTSGELKPGAVVDPGVLMWLAHAAGMQA